MLTVYLYSRELCKVCLFNFIGVKAFVFRSAQKAIMKVHCFGLDPEVQRPS